MVFPVVLGSGKRLFGETSDKKRLQLRRSTDGRRRRRYPGLHTQLSARMRSSGIRSAHREPLVLGPSAWGSRG